MMTGKNSRLLLGETVVMDPLFSAEGNGIRWPANPEALLSDPLRLHLKGRIRDKDRLLNNPSVLAWRIESSAGDPTSFEGRILEFTADPDAERDELVLSEIRLIR